VHLFGVNCNNFITMHGINNVKQRKTLTSVST